MALFTHLQAFSSYAVVFCIHFVFCSDLYLNRAEGAETGVQGNFCKTDTTLISRRLISSVLKCKPAVGAATAPSCLAYTVTVSFLYLLLQVLRLMYLGGGRFAEIPASGRNSSSITSTESGWVRPREVVLSITSATSSSFSPKMVVPTRILRAGSTITSTGGWACSVRATGKPQS